MQNSNNHINSADISLEYYLQNNEVLRLMERNVNDLEISDCKPLLAIALSYLIPSDVLKLFISHCKERPYFPLVIKQMEDIMNGIPVSPQVSSIINYIKNKSSKTGIPLEQVAKDELYNCVVATLDRNRTQPMPWVKFALNLLESCEFDIESELFLSGEVSMVNNPEMGDLMKAICRMGHSDVLLDFIKWDNQVKEHIAKELEVAPSIDNIVFDYPDTFLVIDEIDQKQWNLIWCIIYGLLPKSHRHKLKPSFDINDLPNHKEINNFIKDFNLKPI